MAGPLGAVLAGLILGSFLNVVITRVPRHESLWGPRSRCPHCRRPLAWYDTIPLLSFLWLWGRCRLCGATIPWRYPLVEFLAGLLCLGLWRAFPQPLDLLAYGPFCLLLLTLAAIDLEHRLLPDVLTLPGLTLGLWLSLVLPHLSFLEALSGAVAGALLFFAIRRLYEKLQGRQGLGGGDVKLMAMIGAFLGIRALPFIIFLSSALGLVAGLLLVASQGAAGRRQWRTLSLPFGPFLALGAWGYVFGGEKLLTLINGGG